MGGRHQAGFRLLLPVTHKCQVTGNIFHSGGCFFPASPSAACISLYFSKCVLPKGPLVSSSLLTYLDQKVQKGICEALRHQGRKTGHGIRSPGSPPDCLLSHQQVHWLFHPLVALSRVLPCDNARAFCPVAHAHLAMSQGASPFASPTPGGTLLSHKGLSVDSM